MVDIYTPTQRSRLMSQVRSHGNRTTEMVLLRLLRAHGIRGWRRRHQAFGKPDFAFPLAKLAVFVDGCFWHGCSQHRKIPASNRAFWRKKLAANVARDRRVNRVLRSEGWSVIRIWQHDLAERPQWCVSKIRRNLALRLRESAQIGFGAD